MRELFKQDFPQTRLPDHEVDIYREHFPSRGTPVGVKEKNINQSFPDLTGNHRR